jgi:hypothetical protein
MKAFCVMPALLFSTTTTMAAYDHCSTCTAYYPDASIEDPRSRWGTRRKLTSHACGVDGDTSDCCEFLPDISICGVGVLHDEFVHPCGSCDIATDHVFSDSIEPTSPPSRAPTIAPTPKATKGPKAARTSTLTSITYE